jgi:energy-coupling factor transporter ATP-binding protein EcfA2
MSGEGHAHERTVPPGGPAPASDGDDRAAPLSAGPPAEAPAAENHPRSAVEPADGIVAVYRERAERFFAQRDAQALRSRTIARTRFFVFAAGVVLFLLAEQAGGTERLAFVVAGAATVVVFLALIVVHGKVRARVDRLTRLGAVNLEGVGRLERRWDELPAALPEGDPLLPPHTHPYAGDLDIFGRRASLFRLLSTVSTLPGRTTLARWLLDPSPTEDIPARQDAVRELAPLVDFRDDVAAEGRRVNEGPQKDLERFLHWAEDAPWLTAIGWLGPVSYVLPVLTLGLLVLHLDGWTPYPFWIVPLAAAALIHWRLAPRTMETFDRASAGEGGVRAYAPLLERLSAEEFRSPRLREAAESFSREGEVAHERIGGLRRLLDMSDLRLSMFHLPVQLLTFWDFHVLRRMERWQREAGPHVRDWLDAAGRIDALAALATLAHDHPAWTFPELVPPGSGGALLEARDLGHPLLHPSRCVTNDVEVGPPGSFLLVTGSNMSGKSTLLRALGVNVVLAQAGGPVCASGMRLPPLAIQTSMRISDSLEEGLSHFMAELMRLKGVVEGAAETKARGERTLLYLLDELLQGTNTAERQIAARSIIGHLLDQGAIGAVTTHDLALADAPELQRRSRPVHFRETMRPGSEGPALTFDYRLRPGIATSRNALKLMQLVGLTVRPDEEAGGDADPG